MRGFRPDVIVIKNYRITEISISVNSLILKFLQKRNHEGRSPNKNKSRITEFKKPPLAKKSLIP